MFLTHDRPGACEDAKWRALVEDWAHVGINDRWLLPYLSNCDMAIPAVSLISILVSDRVVKELL